MRWIGYQTRIVSAHRTPDRLYAFAKGAKAAGFKVIIAGAGGAAPAGMTAALTTLPVFGVPVESKALSGAIRFIRSSRCRRACRSARWRSATPAPSTPRCWRRACWRWATPALADRLEAWRGAQTAAVAEAPKEGGA